MLTAFRICMVHVAEATDLREREREREKSKLFKARIFLHVISNLNMNVKHLLFLIHFHQNAYLKKVIM